MGQYVPRQPTFKIDPDLAVYLRQELSRVADSVNLQTDRLRLTPLAKEPTKPRPGDVVYADGANWDPGCGNGVYAYITNDLGVGVWSYMTCGCEDTPGGGGTIVPVGGQAWNPLDKASELSVSIDDTTVTMASTPSDYRAIRAVHPLGIATKRYWEITITADGGVSPPYSMVGLMYATGNLNSFVGAGVGEYGYATKEGCRYASNVNSFPFAPGSWATASVGDTMMFAADTSANQIWWGKNGTWFNTGDPVAGTGSVAGADAAHHPATSLYSLGAQQVANFVGPFLYTPPAGWAGW
jgi:hypothetical protein